MPIIFSILKYILIFAGINEQLAKGLLFITKIAFILLILPIIDRFQIIGCLPPPVSTAAILIREISGHENRKNKRGSESLPGLNLSNNIL